VWQGARRDVKMARIWWNQNEYEIEFIQGKVRAMGVVEDVRQVLQDFLAPELREIRVRLESMDKRLDSQDKRMELHEEAIRARFDVIVQRLEHIQQSFAFDKRISDLEAERRHSA
jgi:hypothetical protein